MEVPQQIPQCFRDKIAIDKAIDKILSNHFRIWEPETRRLYLSLREEQKRLRRLCELNVERHPAGSANAA